MLGIMSYWLLQANVGRHVAHVDSEVPKIATERDLRSARIVYLKDGGGVGQTMRFFAGWRGQSSQSQKLHIPRRLMQSTGRRLCSFERRSNLRFFSVN